RFWPGNALAIHTRTAVPVHEWIHVAARYDGSGTAAGLHLFCNGQRMETDVLRDTLAKDTQAAVPGLTYFSGGTGLVFGERFRSVGLKDCLLDEVQIFDRSLSDVEIAHLHDGQALTTALARKAEGLLRPYYLEAVDPVMAQARAELQQARQEWFAVQT